MEITKQPRARRREETHDKSATSNWIEGNVGGAIIGHIFGHKNYK